MENVVRISTLEVLLQQVRDGTLSAQNFMTKCFASGADSATFGHLIAEAFAIEKEKEKAEAVAEAKTKAIQTCKERIQYSEEIKKIENSDRNTNLTYIQNISNSDLFKAFKTQVFLSSGDYTTQMFVIPSKEKYCWQEVIKYCLEIDIGLNMFMSRTSTGKTKKMVDLILYYKNIGKKQTTLYIPNNCKHLIKQHQKEIKTILKKEKIKSKWNEHSNKFKLADGFKINLKTLNNRDKDLKDRLLNKHDESHPIIIDEFDSVQTQFGLIHGASTNSYSSSNIKSHTQSFKKTEFDILEKLCTQTIVNCFSATLDETITKDLLSYENKMNMNFYIIKHTRESLEHIPIEYCGEEELLNKIVELNYSKEKTLVFVSNTKEMNRVKSYLDEANVKFYKWESKDKKPFDVEGIQNNNISILINGGVRGLDIPEIKNIILFRKLNATTKEDKELLSGLANQIMGRLRQGGKIYRNNNVANKVDNLFDLQEQIFNEVTKIENFYHRMLIRKINNKKKYNNNYQDKIVRLFINSLLKKDKYFERYRGDSISKRFITKYFNSSGTRVPFWEYYEETNDSQINDLKREMKEEISLLQNFSGNGNICILDDEIIQKYLEVEQDLMDFFVKQYDDIVKNGEDNIFLKIEERKKGDEDSDSELDYDSYPESDEDDRKRSRFSFRDGIKNSNKTGGGESESESDSHSDEDDRKRCISSSRNGKKNSNKTGGGKSKPNISEKEKEKGKDLLYRSIKDVGCTGCSVFFEGETFKVIEDCQVKLGTQGNQFMHAEAKAKLSEKEREKSKYALKMHFGLETFINSVDKDTYLLSYNEKDGISINYEEFKDTCQGLLHLTPEEDIKKILQRYHKLQKASE